MVAVETAVMHNVPPVWLLRGSPNWSYIEKRSSGARGNASPSPELESAPASPSSRREGNKHHAEESVLRKETELYLDRSAWRSRLLTLKSTAQAARTTNDGEGINIGTSIV